ncbi:integrase, catalytic region, zinc finger, CCHC-type containing protein [Tanacetum coccineum]
MLLCKQEEAGFQLNTEQADWRDDTNDEPDDQKLEAHYMYMAQIQEVTPDATDNSGPIFDAEPLQKVQNNDDNYNVFAIGSEHPEQPESVNDTYLKEQGDTSITIDSLDMSTNGETVDQDDDGDALAKERDFLASLIEKLKCKIDGSKNRNKVLETSNKALVDKLKGEIEDFKIKNKSLESSNNHFKEANNELSKTNQLMFKDFKNFQAELDRYHNVNYASKVIQVSDGVGPQIDLQDQGVIDSGCSRYMTGNMSYLTDFKEIDGGYVAFGGNPKGEKITGRGTIKTGNLDFENVYFVRELQFNLFSVSQMCDKRNNVLFNDIECIVLSPNFKLIDESHVLLKVPRKNNMYSVDLKNIVPKGGLTCLFAKATSDESKLWHRRLGHINFKTMNKLVKGNLVRGMDID